MEHEGDSSLHRRLQWTVERGAQALAASRALLAQHEAIDSDLKATLAEVRRGREQRGGGTFAFGQVDERDGS